MVLITKEKIIYSVNYCSILLYMHPCWKNVQIFSLSPVTKRQCCPSIFFQDFKSVPTDDILSSQMLIMKIMASIVILKQLNRSIASDSQININVPKNKMTVAVYQFNRQHFVGLRRRKYLNGFTDSGFWLRITYVTLLQPYVCYIHDFTYIVYVM